MCVYSWKAQRKAAHTQLRGSRDRDSGWLSPVLRSSKTLSQSVDSKQGATIGRGDRFGFKAYCGWVAPIHRTRCTPGFWEMTSLMHFGTWNILYKLCNSYILTLIHSFHDLHTLFTPTFYPNFFTCTFCQNTSHTHFCNSSSSLFQGMPHSRRGQTAISSAPQRPRCACSDANVH